MTETTKSFHAYGTTEVPGMFYDTVRKLSRTWQKPLQFALLRTGIFLGGHTEQKEAVRAYDLVTRYGLDADDTYDSPAIGKFASLIRSVRAGTNQAEDLKARAEELDISPQALSVEMAKLRVRTARVILSTPGMG